MSIWNLPPDYPRCRKCGAVANPLEGSCPSCEQKQRIIDEIGHAKELTEKIFFTRQNKEQAMQDLKEIHEILNKYAESTKIALKNLEKEK